MNDMSKMEEYEINPPRLNFLFLLKWRKFVKKFHYNSI